MMGDVWKSITCRVEGTEWVFVVHTLFEIRANKKKNVVNYKFNKTKIHSEIALGHLLFGTWQLKVYGPASAVEEFISAEESLGWGMVTAQLKQSAKGRASK